MSAAQPSEHVRSATCSSVAASSGHGKRGCCRENTPRGLSPYSPLPSFGPASRKRPSGGRCPGAHAATCRPHERPPSCPSWPLLTLFSRPSRAPDPNCARVRRHLLHLCLGFAVVMASTSSVPPRRCRAPACTLGWPQPDLKRPARKTHSLNPASQAAAPRRFVCRADGRRPGSTHQTRRC